MTAHPTDGRRCGHDGCTRTQEEHHGPIGPGLDHVFVVRPGDEWCEDCQDWVVNGCGTEQACLAEQQERRREFEDENPSMETF